MKIPRLVLPVLVIGALFGGYFLRTAFTQPTTAMTVGDAEGYRLECVVDGVKCKGTAQFFTSLYQNVEGIAGIETYAADHRVIFTYDPNRITPERIQSIMEEPVLLDDGSRVQVFKCLTMSRMEGASTGTLP